MREPMEEVGAEDTNVSISALELRRVGVSARSVYRQ